MDCVTWTAASAKELSDVSRGQMDTMKQAEQGVEQISDVVEANSANAQETSANQWRIVSSGGNYERIDWKICFRRLILQGTADLTGCALLHYTRKNEVPIIGR